ncbi:hypothetical protein ACFQ0K_19000 [Nocardioides caeni]|uniref:Uncharacterized protein n=1 Tax=Nocardioides caeni TaxID=574700 RepID=A0A4S8MZA9_9ACTN|nr:hypothetical protein [Nocardioides caeni]THV08810.1 hypothetical protein E9934_18955 [Nocardioides caeni]
MAPSQWDNYTPDPTPEPEQKPAPRPPKQPRIQSPKPARTVEERTIAKRKQVGKIILVAVLTGVVALIGWIVFAVVDNATQPGPQTADGFEEMLDDLEDELGSTVVFGAVIYPGYASIDTPFADDDRSVNYYWDGGLDESTKGTSTIGSR